MSRKDAYAWKAVVDVLLLPDGFSLISERYDAEIFGSFVAIYERESAQVIYIWDGKDGWGYLEIRGEGEKSWVELGGTVPKDASDEVEKAALVEWRSQLQAALS